MRNFAHRPRLLEDGRWVCKGGMRSPFGDPCAFETSQYAEAVNHATAHGAMPPDMPRDQWVTA